MKKNERMKEKEKIRVRRITFRLTEAEHQKITREWSSTTCRKLSDFIRRKLFAKALVTVVRNRSLDDFMAEMIQLRRELNAIGNNFNQAVHRLHMSDSDQEIKIWLRLLQQERSQLLEHTEKIQNKINTIADEWLQ
jgi:hypothetical protein